jgi:hypothetical protein
VQLCCTPCGKPWLNERRPIYFRLCLGWVTTLTHLVVEQPNGKGAIGSEGPSLNSYGREAVDYREKNVRAPKVRQVRAFATECRPFGLGSISDPFHGLMAVATDCRAFGAVIPLSFRRIAKPLTNAFRADAICNRMRRPSPNSTNPRIIYK